MGNTENLRETYNRIATDYTADHLNDSWDDNYREIFCSLLFPNSKVLDLGCGPGTDSGLLIESGLDVTGLDLSEELLKIAKAQNPGTEFVQGDMLNLPFSSATFDAIFAKASLLHVAKSDMRTALKEIQRVTKCGGLVHIAIKGGNDEKVVTEDNFGYEYKRFFAYWQMDEFTTLLENEQLAIIESGTRRGSTTTWLQFLARSF